MIGIPELFILIIVFAPGLIALLDILKSDFKGNDKIVWLLAVLFVPYIGAIAYFFIGRKQKVKKVAG
jgi:hypothetical protein